MIGKYSRVWAVNFRRGKSCSGKDAVINAMIVRGFDPGDDNEADALALLGWAMEHRMVEDAIGAA